LQLNFRITEEIRACFDDIERRTGQKDYVVARSLFHALVEHWNRCGTLTLPFTIADGGGGGSSGGGGSGRTHGAPTFKSAWGRCGDSRRAILKKEWRLRRNTAEPT
jgi:hypothetical protein